MIYLCSGEVEFILNSMTNSMNVRDNEMNDLLIEKMFFGYPALFTREILIDGMCSCLWGPKFGWTPTHIIRNEYIPVMLQGKNLWQICEWVSPEGVGDTVTYTLDENGKLLCGDKRCTYEIGEV